jgi:hypothetical protein
MGVLFFLQIRLFDGLERTGANAAGNLPSIFSASGWTT